MEHVAVYTYLVHVACFSAGAVTFCLGCSCTWKEESADRRLQHHLPCPCQRTMQLSGLASAAPLSSAGRASQQKSLRAFWPPVTQVRNFR